MLEDLEDRVIHKENPEEEEASIFPEGTSTLEKFAELDAIDNIGDMTYHEKHAFNLEHFAYITCLIHIRMPNQMPSSDLQEDTTKSTLGCNERKGFFFASADSFGTCKVWEVDRKASLFGFKHKEELYSGFDAGSPPPVRALVQVKHYLVACLAFLEGATTI